MILIKNNLSRRTNKKMKKKKKSATKRKRLGRLDQPKTTEDIYEEKKTRSKTVYLSLEGTYFNPVI